MATEQEDAYRVRDPELRSTQIVCVSVHPSNDAEGNVGDKCSVDKLDGSVKPEPETVKVS